MATYNKRGYKAPKEKVKDDKIVDETLNIDEKDSTTAGVFNKLDEGASKTEAWVAKNQKIILGVISAVAVAIIGFMLYKKFIADPKEMTAAEDMFVAQQNFQKAVDGVKSDSLFNLALNGSEGKQGFVQIADQYSGTATGNLANYYAGVAYLNTGKYAEAIQSLEKFKSEDRIIQAMAKGLIGDAFAQKNQLKEAVDYYLQAANYDKNEFTTPRYLLKAGQAQLALGNKAEALKHFNEIKETYKDSPEGMTIDAMIGLAQ
jgi:tetratricopeptide (TPR) repeat protein